MKMKKAIIMVAAVAGASAANAAWETGASVIENPAISPAGELVLTVWNEVTLKSFTQDLGADVWQWLGGSAASPQSFTLDSAGVNYVGGNLADIQWNVVGLNYNVKAAADGTSGHREHRGFYMTSNGGVPTESYNSANFSGNLSLIQDYSTDLGTADSGTAEDPVFLLSGDSYAGSGMVWGSPARGINVQFGGFQTAGDNLETLAAYAISFEPTGSWIPAVEQRGFWQLDMASGKLNYNSGSTEVPVPAAAWLFSSALLGLAGIGRTRRMKAQ